MNNNHPQVRFGKKHLHVDKKDVSVAFTAGLNLQLSKTHVGAVPIEALVRWIRHSKVMMTVKRRVAHLHSMHMWC